MVDEDLGTATIVYDDPGEGTVEHTVENEHVAYFQDHWIVKMEETDDGDVVRRIPKERVHYVEREVEEFREEVGTLTNQLESVADDLRERLLGSDRRSNEGPTRVDVQSGGESDDDR
ncbi:hypothetical protein [Halorarius halobius]|uniref:hypothetical protein n=1 Tax=Halorarius halobius TaxID=2962671 RepID=UPI0020CC4CA5|nr:hypothetical protein [Halorarius halobius]